MTKSDDNIAYWNSHYGKKTTLRIPSQFAAFVLSEYYVYDKFIDLGCGNGRDSFFFAEHDKQVIGVDGADAAVQACNAQAQKLFPDTLRFAQLDFSDAAACDAFVAQHADRWAGSLVYARFFLHAIDEEAERNFMKLALALIGAQGRICVEFRTDRDAMQPKVTSAHYRRFIDPVDFINNMNDFGLKVEYYTSGFGFAKYKADDAHVARFVLCAA